MNYHSIDWDSVPDTITKEQLYQVCHISKATARYLLQSGKIPCQYTGKKTRCYVIRKEDVLAYLENRKLFPENYSMPSGLRKGKCGFTTSEEIPAFVLSEMKDYYTDLLSEYPDVLKATDIVELTGYAKTSVNNWCLNGRLKAIKKNCINLIPKVYLVDFSARHISAQSPAKPIGIFER